MLFSTDAYPKAKSSGPCSTPKTISQRIRRLLPLGVIIAVITAGKVALTGHLLINYTASIPRGVYWISPGQMPQRGELVAFPIPESVREVVHGRRYLPASVELLAKPLAAVGGDHVCIRNHRLVINGSFVAQVRDNDQQGRPVPHSAICETLNPDQVFVATRHENSFDSRNFGPVSVHSLRGTLTPLLTVL
jgi:conjugative transfer signal peptidase TraF